MTVRVSVVTMRVIVMPIRVSVKTSKYDDGVNMMTVRVYAGCIICEDRRVVVITLKMSVIT